MRNMALGFVIGVLLAGVGFREYTRDEAINFASMQAQVRTMASLCPSVTAPFTKKEEPKVQK